VHRVEEARNELFRGVVREERSLHALGENEQLSARDKSDIFYTSNVPILPHESLLAQRR